MVSTRYPSRLHLDLHGPEDKWVVELAMAERRRDEAQATYLLEQLLLRHARRRARRRQAIHLATEVVKG